jgi:hypothetical protein
MADSTGSEAECSSFITRIVTEWSEVSCKCCDELKHELTNTLSEMKTALKIIKILQEDDNTKWTGCNRKSVDESKSNQKEFLMHNNEMEGEWTVVKSNRYKNTRRPIMKHPNLFAKNVNRYEVLQNIEERTTTSQIIGLTNNREKTAKKRQNLQKKKPKIVVVGDSHTRGTTGELRHNFGSAFEVIGYVKPGSSMKVVTDTARKEITTLTKEDMVVLWGGANDIAKNEANNSLTHITNFVKLRKHMNVLIVDAPTRFDLPTASCVNKEVILYNRKLYKGMKQFEHVNIIHSELHRKYFTKHGMYMNTAGKEQTAKD